MIFPTTRNGALLAYLTCLPWKYTGSSHHLFKISVFDLMEMGVYGLEMGVIFWQWLVAS